MHALGVIHGFQRNGYKTVIYSGFFEKQRFLHGEYKPHLFLNLKLSTFFWRTKFWLILILRFNLSFYDRIIIRYSMSSIVFFLILILTRKNKLITIELNSLCSDWVKIEILKTIIFFVESKILSNFKNIICVSNLHCKLFSNSTFIPNGCFPIIFQNKEFFNNELPNIKIFGTLHDYYDYDCFEVLDKILKTKIVNTIQVYGSGTMFDKLSQKYNHFSFYGHYNHYELSNLISINNDILFVPPKKEFDLKFTGGLSTRLFEFIGSGAITLLPNYEDTPFDKKSVFVYDYRDITTITDLIIKIISLKGKLSKLTSKNQSDFLSKYSWESRVKEMINM